MKKSKLLIGVVALSVALMGTGYAWWTQAIVAQGTVTSGMMDVKLTAADLSAVAPDGNDKYLEITKPNISLANNKSFNFGIANMYPKSEATLTFTVDNTSTVPMVLNKFDLTCGDPDLMNVLEFTLNGDTSTTYTGITKLKEALEDGLNDGELPNGSKTYTIGIRMPESIGEGTTNTIGTEENPLFTEFIDKQSLSENFTCTVSFKQFNDTTTH